MKTAGATDLYPLRGYTGYWSELTDIEVPSHTPCMKTCDDGAPHQRGGQHWSATVWCHVNCTSAWTVCENTPPSMPCCVTKDGQLVRGAFLHSSEVITPKWICFVPKHSSVTPQRLDFNDCVCLSYQPCVNNANRCDVCMFCTTYGVTQNFQSVNKILMVWTK